MHPICSRASSLTLCSRAWASDPSRRMYQLDSSGLKGQQHANATRCALASHPASSCSRDNLPFIGATRRVWGYIKDSVTVVLHTARKRDDHKATR